MPMTYRVPTRALLELLAAATPVTEADLARGMRASVPAVREGVARLRDFGLPVHVDLVGRYSLPWPVQLLDADAIEAHLGPDARGTVEVCWDLDSTSSELARRRHAAADLSVVLAERQTAGRGRIGRSWTSPPALNLSLSCLKRFARGLAELPGLSLAVGVMLANALEDLGIHDVSLKWPNDLIARDAKLAGVLVEVAGANRGPATAIIGVGINVRLPPETRACIGRPVIDLADLAAGMAPDRNALAARVVVRLREGLARFGVNGFGAFIDDFARRDWLRGKSVRIDAARGAVAGVVAGVDRDGSLRVRTADGEIGIDSAQEIKVRVR